MPGRSSDAQDAVQQLTERYDCNADVYRELWAPVLRTAALPLARALEGQADLVLDVGTGVGTLLQDLSGIFPAARLMGVDRSRGMLALAPSRYGRALMDAQQLGLRSGSVDRVLMVFMLFHLEDPAAGLREARRVLRAGGRIGTLTWAGELASKANSIWVSCLDEFGAIPRDPAAETRHETVDTPAKMTGLFREAGFDSPDAWEDDLAHSLDADHLVRLKTSLGASKPRFDSLSPAAATACVEEARRRMKALAPEDFIARGRVVYAVASR
jgi:ubiquinone/menaquinone biosynthesis C-methylase UbiE